MSDDGNKLTQVILVQTELAHKGRIDGASIGEVTFLGDNLSLDEFGKSLRRVGRREWFVFFFEFGGRAVRSCLVRPDSVVTRQSGDGKPIFG